MHLIQKLRRRHLSVLEDMQVRDFWILGRRCIDALERVEIRTVEDLLGMSPVYASLLPRDVYEAAAALQQYLLDRSEQALNS